MGPEVPPKAKLLLSHSLHGAQVTILQLQTSASDQLGSKALQIPKTDMVSSLDLKSSL